MKISGAKIIVNCLIEQEVEYVFGYPGANIIDVFDELYLAKDKITQILTCHEQGASHAADGLARASGKVGVVMSTSGPGATNLVTGLATAFMDSIPVVAITGNVPLNSLGRDSFQEVDIAGVTMPVTKHNYIVSDIAHLASTIREAFIIAKSGRPGAVLVDIPKNIQQEFYEYEPQLPTPVKHKLIEQNMADAISKINAAHRPILYVGGGVISSGASAELIALAEKLNAPVACSTMSLGAFPASHPLFLGMIGMHGHAGVAKALTQCDAVIALGARFSDRVASNRNKFCSQAQIIHIDIDNAEIDKNVATSSHILGDIKLVIGEILPQLSSKGNEWATLTHKLVIDNPVKENNMRLNPREILRSLRRKGGEDLVVATDVGQHQMWTAQTYKFEKPRKFISSGGLGTMGFGVGAAIGACLTTKERVVLITGDGSFHMNMNEVVTASRLGLPIIIFVFNNKVLGMVRQLQTMFYGKRYASTILENPTDYMKLADAYGVKGYRLSRNDQINEVLDKAFAEKGTVIVECEIFEDEAVMPMIPAGKNFEDIIVDISDKL